MTQPSKPEDRPGSIRFKQTIPGGWNWSHVLKRGTTLRIVDVEGRANVSVLLFNADFPVERINVPDSLKAQHTAYFTTGRVIMSDMGRVLASIVEDTCGGHEAFCGVSNAALVAEKYGPSSFSKNRNDWARNGFDSLLVELGKWGLGLRDFVANVTFFSLVDVDEEGNLSLREGHSRPGARVDVRAEMNTLVVLNTCPHPLDPSPTYAPGPVELIISDSPRAEADDPCRTSCEENERAFLNTEEYFL